SGPTVEQATRAVAHSQDNKLGLKSGPPKPDPELEKLKKENAALKKKLDDFSRSKEKISDVERSRLLEKILTLETLKVKNAQEITRQNEEIQSLKDSLKSKLNGHIAAAEKDSRMMARLAQDLRNQMPAGPSSSQEAAQQNPQVKIALEKNQQWLEYDQQRETYVQGLMARIFELEQQLATLNQKLQQQVKDTASEGELPSLQKYYDKLLLTAKKELEEEKKQSVLLNAELSASRAKHEAQQKEMEDLSTSLRSVRESERQLREDDRKRMKDKVMRLKIELEMCKDKAEDEKKRSSELSDQKLHDACYSDSFNNVRTDFEDKLSMREQYPSPTSRNLLDESFLECPKCKAVYPTSEHRELLAHLDYCTS
uniref:Centrosomal protein 55 n=1 Tax=Leptobrachium leishanense TaxID=445787 RepID=A0A8C5MKH1_9ANUR